MQPNQKTSSKKLRNTKASVPMKMRTLPKSFWQQPNEAKNETLTMELEDSDEDNLKENKFETTTNANTDLLFSLFQIIKKKNQLNHKIKRKEIIGNDDPCVVNNVLETLHEKAIKKKSIQKIILKTDPEVTNNYSKILSDLVVQL